MFATYDDHRLATAGAVLGLAVSDVQVENIATTGKTLPQFADLWTDMLGESVHKVKVGKRSGYCGAGVSTTTKRTYACAPGAARGLGPGVARPTRTRSPAS